MSYLFRRSGLAVGLISDLLKWRADRVYQVGVGGHHQEVDVLRKEWRGVKFTGCEPHPAMCRRIRRSYPGDLREVAISDFVGKADLHVKSRHADGSTLFPITDKGGMERCEVVVETLDHLFPGPHGERILLWLDCEGSELKVLQGGREFLKRVEMVNVELTGNRPHPDWCDPVDVHRLLMEAGFFTQHVHTHRLSAGQYDAIYVRGMLFDPLFCCVPTEVERHRSCCWVLTKEDACERSAT